jgi:translation initiation factor IF-2
MAKSRVYELARELNMTNKVLLDKIREMDIEVRSHMSSLDDKAVHKIRTALLGKKANKVSDQRIQSTVIRRRRKKDRKEESVSEKTSAPSEADSEVEEVTRKKPAPLESKTKISSEKVSPAEGEVSSGKMDVAEKKAKPVQEISETDTSEEKKSAKVEEKSIVEESAVALEPTTETAEVKEEAHSTSSEKSRTPKTSEPKKPEAKKTREKKKTEEELVSESFPLKGAEEKKAPSVKAKKKPRKRVKKATAAKIIKLPDHLENTAAEPSLPKGEIAPAAPSSPPLTTGKSEKKAFETSEEPSTPPKKAPRKKGGIRKKAVIEGASLYEKDRTKKSRKTGKGGKSARSKSAPAQKKTTITTPKAIKRRVKIDDTIVLSELAKRMGIKANEMIQKLMMVGVMVTVNQTIDFDTAALVAAEFGYEVERAAFEEESLLHMEQDQPENLLARPPVVTIMGHVDHGKTSLLDVIRKTHVTDAEAGGITQHIGAYNVMTEKGQIVFLDTPGHEAFTAMRSRGAQITDIVILVVAADDGVMPQTIEAINHSKAAGVPIIVAINKIDKENADPDRVKRELSDHGIISEEWGGDTIFVDVSAKKNIGINDLLEMVLLQAEVLELKANPNKLARGHVIEAKLDSGRGPVATLLIQEGTLHSGEPAVCGLYFGKIRAMLNDQGKTISKAGPAMPVEILGLNGVPMAGDEFIALADEKDAKQVSQHRVQKQRAKELAKSSRLSLEKLFEKMEEGEIKELNLIIKADVHGSIEALKDSLSKLSTDEVKINIIHSATGTITESDISLATVSNAIIIGFNVRPGAKVQEMASEENVDMRFYNVIYNAIKDIQDALVGMMEPTFEERILGRAEVRDTFVIPKKGTIAGCFVTDGKISRGRNVRLLRDGIIIYDGKLASLRRYKDDVKEVTVGYECGLGIENFNDIKIGDLIECYYFEEIKPTISQSSA